MSTDLDTKFSTIQAEAKSLLATFQDRHGKNFKTNGWLIGIGIAVAASMALGGVFGCPKAAATFGVFSTVIFAFHGSYAMGEKAEFQRIVALEAGILLEDIQLCDRTDEHFLKLKRRLDALRRHADTKLPKGAGMEAVRRMDQALRKASDGE